MEDKRLVFEFSVVIESGKITDKEKFIIAMMNAIHALDDNCIIGIGPVKNIEQ